MRRLAFVGAVLSLAGCATGHRGETPAVPGSSPGVRDGVGFVARSFERRPSVVVVEREGDPSPAVAVNLAMPELVSATALLAFVEARLAKAGVARFDGQADRLGLRVRVWVADPSAAAQATREVLRALTTPLDADPAARKLAIARVAALAARPADDPSLLPLLQCTGQALYAGEALPSLDKDADLAALEAVRKRAVGHATVTVGVVGAAAVGVAVADGIAKADAWASAGERAPTSVPTAEIAYIEPTRRRGTVRVSVARATSSPFEALSFAEPDRVAAVSSHLARARASKLQQVQATAHVGGSCAMFEVDSDGDVDTAAATAKLLRDELSRPVARDAALARSAVQRLEDPRDAAAAAALFGAVDGNATGTPTFVSALGVAAPRAKQPELDAVRKEAVAALGRALGKSDASSAGVEVRVRAEPGQRDVWVALGSTCAITDPDSAAGLTAAVLSSLVAAKDLEDVVLEPWSSPSSAGILAHGPPRAGERDADHARRVARVAARALLGAPPKADAATASRMSLLSRIDDPRERAREPVVSVLGRGRVAHFLPWGTSDGLAHVDAASLASRWSSLVNGPLRVAIVSPSNLDHAKAASEEVELFTRGADVRRCPTAPPWERPAAGTRTALPLPGMTSRAYVGTAVDARSPVAAAALAAMLSDPAGAVAMLARARGLALRTYLLGELDAALLVVELSGPSGALDTAATEIAAAVVAVGKAPVDAAIDRALVTANDDDFRDRASQRRRVLELFRDRPPPAATTRDAVADLARRTLTAASLSVVVSVPKTP